jgi:putative SOS response-associated peptidase YedK
MPESFDAEYPGCYNARRDSLKGFWRDLYCSHHGVVILSSFYEHVPRHRVENRLPVEAPGTVQVEFRPDQPQDLLAACIWSKWSRPGQPDLVSFALITEDPPPEIAAVGHDRCICPIRPEDLDAWLRPSRTDVSAQDAILDRRLRPHYGHSVVVPPATP